MEPISGALDQFGQDTDQVVPAQATVDQPADSDGKTRETSSERVETTFEEPALLADRNVEVYGRASALLFINDKQLPGFHHDYVKRLGRNSVAPGLCVEVRPRWGPNTESVLSLKLLIRDGNVSYPFAYIEINMSKLEEVVSTQVFSTTDSDAINRLITPGIQSFPGAVEVINPEEKHRDLFNDVEESASLAEYIRTATSSFASASVIVNAGHVTQVYPPSFWGSLATFPTSLQTIVRDVRALIQQSLQPHSVIKWVVISPATEGWNKRWDLFKSRDIRRGAYQAFTCACRGGNIDDLDYENTTFDDVDRTDSCGGAARVFISRDERTVSLVVGAADEGMCKIKQAIACAEITFPAAMFPVPNSEWKAKPSDLEVYGISANSQPRAYIVAVILNKDSKRETLPEIGTRAELFLNVGQRPHPVPPIQLSPGQAADLAIKLQNHFAASIAKAHNKLVDAEDMYDKLVRMKASEEEIAKQQDYIDTVYENTYMEYATANVLGYISRISDHITHETPNATDDVRRWIQAQLIAQELRAQPGEDEIAHYNRIQTWLFQQRNIIRPVVNQRQDEPWKGFRVNLPAGVREDIALFYVEVPLQADWPRGFEQPPFIVDAPRRVPLSLGAYFANITRGEKNLFARIEYDVNDKSLCYEANAINLMNNVEDNSSAAEWWEYILAFNPDLITRELDLWARFPGIADGAANGHFVGRHLEAAYMLRKTRQGKVIITGGPGSGKTYFGTLIAQAVVKGGVVDTSRTSSISIPSAANMTWAELERQWNRQTNALRKALVVWTAPQNAQVLDAATRLHKTIPGGIIVKVHTWKAEVAALLDAGVRIPELMEPRPNATATERTIARLVNAFRKKEFNKLSPATNPYSISSQLRARAMANPGANRLLFEI
ncbi:hypothetical protein TGAMA5MH_10716 [Trichoderma gamsii]|uniref:DNA2/NAM7 helicase helicase domain-containing protein n=1 Tax=Trichoderma gamsii TaxID=398673 RepID=A0A2K0SVN1_9HYPO|nr:hypothetical protein TGAMA5MH_10716 [Trichoderma gamsii]